MSGAVVGRTEKPEQELLYDAGGGGLVIQEEEHNSNPSGLESWWTPGLRILLSSPLLEQDSREIPRQGSNTAREPGALKIAKGKRDHELPAPER